MSRVPGVRQREAIEAIKAVRAIRAVKALEAVKAIKRQTCRLADLKT